MSAAGTPVVLRIYDFGVAYLRVDAPIPSGPWLMPRDPRARWRKAHRLSREMGWRGAVRVQMVMTFARNATPNNLMCL